MGLAYQNILQDLFKYRQPCKEHLQAKVMVPPSIILTFVAIYSGTHDIGNQ